TFNTSVYSSWGATHLPTNRTSTSSATRASAARTSSGIRGPGGSCGRSEYGFHRALQYSYGSLRSVDTQPATRKPIKTGLPGTKCRFGNAVRIRRMPRRLERIEERVRPRRRDGMYTLEELCREIWCSDEKAFRKMAAGSMLSHFIPQFEREDHGG